MRRVAASLGLNARGLGLAGTLRLLADTYVGRPCITLAVLHPYPHSMLMTRPPPRPCRSTRAFLRRVCPQPELDGLKRGACQQAEKSRALSSEASKPTAASQPRHVTGTQAPSAPESTVDDDDDDDDSVSILSEDYYHQGMSEEESEDEESEEEDLVL